MGEQKKENKNGHDCCSMTDANCCGMGHYSLRVFVKTAIIVIVFLIGFCLGSRFDDPKNDKAFSDNFRSRVIGGQCQCQNDNAATSTDEAPKTTSTSISE